MGKHVLLIEDEPNIIEAISYILRQDGWRVTAQSDGATAMEAVLRISPALVILDVMLPGRSGFEILQDLRACDETASLPVLMLTAKGQAKDRAVGESFGANTYMTKPFSNAEMLDAVRALAS
jgi:DNA-binding response OmpR family regulator